MDFLAILKPVIAIGGMGLVFGTGLCIAAKKFAVPVDERVEKIKENLPGANCGGCGFAGCEAFAKSVIEGKSKPNGCAVCSPEQVAAIASIMGVEAEVGVRKVARVSCKGSHDKAKEKYEYQGIHDCLQASLVGGGPKVCKYGCIGLGTCMTKCNFNAIKMENGICTIDEEKCLGCGSCAAVCPKEIIQLVPIDAPYFVACKSKDKGKDVKQHCAVGCIGCGICAKQCEVGAIEVKEGVAKIDYSLCTKCGKCEAKCPTHAITNLLKTKESTQGKEA